MAGNDIMKFGADWCRHCLAKESEGDHEKHKRFTNHECIHYLKHSPYAFPRVQPAVTRSSHKRSIMSSADDQYEQQNDVTGGDVPSGSKIDNDYASRTGQYQIPVQKDEAPVADPINPDTADSDQTLGMFSRASSSMYGKYSRLRSTGRQGSH